MVHRLAPEAEVELDEIWLWTAKESGSVDVADRLIDSITRSASFCLPAIRIWADRGTTTCGRDGPLQAAYPSSSGPYGDLPGLNFPCASKCDAIRLHS